MEIVKGDPGIVWKTLDGLYYSSGDEPCRMFSFRTVSRAYVRHAAKVLNVSIVPKIKFKKDVLYDLALLCISRWRDPYNVYGTDKPKCTGCPLKMEKNNDYFECVGYQKACKLIEAGKLPNKKQFRKDS